MTVTSKDFEGAHFWAAADGFGGRCGGVFVADRFWYTLNFLIPIRGTLRVEAPAAKGAVPPCWRASLPVETAWRPEVG